jgi:hypothetical protein
MWFIATQPRNETETGWHFGTLEAALGNHDPWLCGI